MFTEKYFRYFTRRKESLPADMFRLEQAFKVELARIFESGWYCVGITNEFDDVVQGFKAYDILNKKSIIISKKNNTYKAFFNVCRHRGNQLVDIEDMAKNKQKLVCHYHCWSYDLDGNLQNTPRCTTIKKSDYSLLPLTCKIIHNFIFICINDIPPVLHLEDFWNKYKPYAHTVLVDKQTYTVPANWKILMGNFCCYYHLPSVHPWLNTVSTIQNHHHCAAEGSYLHFKTDPLKDSLESPLITRTPMNKNTPRNIAHFFILWPNVVMFVLCDHVFVIVMKPLNAEKTVEDTYLLVNPAQAHNKSYIEKLKKFYKTTNDEDIKVCCSVQKGIQNTSYSSGKYVFPQEHYVAKFDEMYIKSMTKILSKM